MKNTKKVVAWTFLLAMIASACNPTTPAPATAVPQATQPPAAEVMLRAVGLLHAAAPFPAPAKLRSVPSSDIWLVHKTGRFQLDTLTEGQR